MAALVILINGYLLVDFFGSEGSGALFTSAVSVLAVAYICFVVYLVARSIAFSSMYGKARTTLGIR